MKKTIYTFTFAIALASVSPANAIVSSLVTEDNNNNNLQTVQKELCYMTIDGQEDCSNLQKPILDPIVQVDPDPDINYPVINPGINPVILDPIPLNSATVSSCPSGTTKSSDGCCCVNN